jgi:hypothetical protein
MFGLFKGRKSKQGPAVPAMLDVTIGRAVEVERLAYEFWPDDCLVELESPTLEIVAQGQCDLGEGAFLHRFYPDNDSCLLQMQGGDGVDNTRSSIRPRTRAGPRSASRYGKLSFPFPNMGCPTTGFGLTAPTDQKIQSPIGKRFTTPLPATGRGAFSKPRCFLAAVFRMAAMRCYSLTWKSPKMATGA